MIDCKILIIGISIVLFFIGVILYATISRRNRKNAKYQHIERGKIYDSINSEIIMEYEVELPFCDRTYFTIYRTNSTGEFFEIEISEFGNYLSSRMLEDGLVRSKLIQAGKLTTHNKYFPKLEVV